MKKPPKMPIHIGDYRRDTGHLRAAGHGAYLLLMFHYWSTGSLPDDDDQLAAIACMSRAEWKRMRPVIEKFFQQGWKHKRIDHDLADATESYLKLALAGKKGGQAKASLRNRSSDAVASPQQPLTFKKEERTSSLRSDDADASDPRTRLFNEGLQKLGLMTGKGPDACRSFIGKCLKSAEDSAVVVLGLIEDAERNRVADPAAWIAARLKTKGPHHGRLQQAADDLLGRIAAFDADEPGVRGGTGEGTVQLLPPSRRK